MISLIMYNIDTHIHNTACMMHILFDKTGYDKAAYDTENFQINSK